MHKNCNFAPTLEKVRMKKLPILAILVILAMAHSASVARISPHTSNYYEETDSVTSDSTKSKASNDTSVNVRTKTLDTLVVNSKEKELPVIDAIRQSMNNGLVTPRQKSVSDVIGSKASDYILNPFGFKKRHDDKVKKRTEKNLKSLRTAESYEDELTRAIMEQLLEDSINAAKNK